MLTRPSVLNGGFSLATACALLPFLAAMACVAPSDAAPGGVAGSDGASWGKVDGFTIEDHPWVVGLVRAGGVYCTGSLVGARTVLTAAHCVTPHPPEAVFFDQDRHTLGEASLVEVFETAVAPGYRAEGEQSYFDHTPTENDVAVLTLVEDVSVVPVALNSGALDGYALGLTLAAAGWADPDIEGRGDGRVTAVHHPVTVFSETAIFSRTSEICPGDSGGPSFWMSEGGPVQLGITSWGTGGCSTKNVSMRTDAYLPFIAEVMAEHGDAPRLFDVPGALRSEGPSSPWPHQAEPFEFGAGEVHEVTLTLDDEGIVDEAYVFIDLDHMAPPLVDLSLEHEGRRVRVADGGYGDPMTYGATDAFSGLRRGGAWTLRVRVSEAYGGGRIRAWGIGFANAPEGPVGDDDDDEPSP